jgi:hypothetical protein
MSINNNVKNIRAIVNYLRMLDIVDDNVKVDPRAIAINANVFNSMLYDIYQYREYKSAKDLAKYLNKKYKTKLDERDINKIWENEFFMDFMNMTYNKHAKIVNEIKQVQEGSHPACEMSGGNKQPLDVIDYDDNMVRDVMNALDDKEFAERDDVKSVVEQIPIFKAYADREWDEIGKLLSDWIISLNLERYVDMIFFPLYYLEQGETFGKYNSILIDLIGLWLNGVAIFLGFITPIFFKGMGIMLTAAATVPGLNVGAAPLATVLGIAEGPLTALISALPMFFKFLMSLQRKDFKRALDYLGQIFPSLGVAMISATNIVTMMNKLLLLVNDGVEFLGDNIARYKSLLPNDINNLFSLDMDTGYRNFVRPNMNTSPLVKGITKWTGLDKTMENYRNKKRRIMDKYNEEQRQQMGGIMRDLIEKQNEMKKLI